MIGKVDKLTGTRITGRIFGFLAALSVFSTLAYFFILNHYVSHYLTYFEWLTFVFLFYFLYISVKGGKVHGK